MEWCEIILLGSGTQTARHTSGADDNTRNAKFAFRVKRAKNAKKSNPLNVPLEMTHSYHLIPKTCL